MARDPMFISRYAFVVAGALYFIRAYLARDLVPHFILAPLRYANGCNMRWTTRGAVRTGRRTAWWRGAAAAGRAVAYTGRAYGHCWRAARQRRKIRYGIYSYRHYSPVHIIYAHFVAAVTRDAAILATWTLRCSSI